MNTKKQEKQNIEVKPDVILNKNTEEILIDNEKTENIVQKTELLVVPPSVLNIN